jgi:hypothetical protein
LVLLCLLTAPAAGYAADCPITTATDTSDECVGACPDAKVTACPSTKKAAFYSGVEYVFQENVSACDSSFPSGCADQRATCECPGGLGTDCPHKQCDIILRGDLWVPKPIRSKGYPAIIYSHGSVSCPDGDTSCTHAPAVPCSIVSYFVAKNYAVFTPRRRGYGDSTGTYGSDWVDFECGTSCGPLRPLLGTLELESEAADVVAAFHFLQSFATTSNVNASKVALMGHSLGGIVSIFTNEQDLGHLGTISIAGGSESWCANDVLAGALTGAVDSAKTPTYFFEPKNDVDLSPTIELAHEAGTQLERYDSAVFGPVRDKAGDPLTCGKQAHVCFTKDANEVKRWGPSVLEFLQRYGVK